MKEEPLRGHWSTGHRTHSARAAATSSAVLCGGKTGLYGRTLSSVPLIQLGVTSPSYPISYCIHKVIELALRYLYKKRREKINDLCFCCRAEHQLWCLCSVKKTKPASKSQSIRNVFFFIFIWWGIYRFLRGQLQRNSSPPSLSIRHHHHHLWATGFHFVYLTVTSSTVKSHETAL